MVNQAQSEDGMLEALDGVAYSLAELAMSLVPERGEKVVASEQETLLLLLLSSTVSLPLSSESAERVARTVVAITSCLSKESEQVAELKTNVNKIVGKLESVHPEIYHAFLLNTDSASITFLPGVEAPTDEEVEVSRLINQNPVLIFFSSKALLKCTDEKAVSKTLRKHLSKLEKVLASPTSFLLTQMEVQIGALAPQSTSCLWLGGTIPTGPHPEASLLCRPCFAPAASSARAAPPSPPLHLRAYHCQGGALQPLGHHLSTALTPLHPGPFLLHVFQSPHSEALPRPAACSLRSGHLHPNPQLLSRIGHSSSASSASPCYQRRPQFLACSHSPPYFNTAGRAYRLGGHQQQR